MNKLGLLACTAIGVSGIALTVNQAAAFEKAQLGERAVAQTQLEFDIYLPLEQKAELLKLEEALQTPGSPQYHQWLKPAEFAARFAPSQATVNKITRELNASGLQVTEVHSHSLHVTGSVGAVEHAFATELATAHFSNGRSTLAATKPMVLTPSLAASGAVVPKFESVIRMQKPLMIRADPAGQPVEPNRRLLVRRFEGSL